MREQEGGIIILHLLALAVTVTAGFLTTRRADPIPFLKFIPIYLGGMAVFSLNVSVDLGLVAISGGWVRSLAVVCFCIVAIYVFRLDRHAVGLVLPLGRSAWLVSVGGALACLVFTSLFVLLDVFLFRPGVSHVALGVDWLYVFSMPGLLEELAFRGIALAVLSSAVPSGAMTMPALAVTALFGLAHVTLGDEMVPNLPRVAAALCLGGILLFIRLRSGSLLGGVLAHNAVNLTAFLLYRLLG